MKRLLLSTATAVALFAPGSAKALLISIDADTLRDANGDLFPVSGLVVLIAATTSNTFLGPTPTSFATGPEIVLGTWDLSAFATPGVFSDITQNLAFSGDWGAGDALRLYWFPTLTLASTEPGAGTSYGTYSDLVGIDGSDPWVTPADEGATLSLRYATTDATFLFAAPGSNLPATAIANLTVASSAVVPEPGTVLFGLALLGAVGLTRRRN